MFGNSSRDTIQDALRLIFIGFPHGDTQILASMSVDLFAVEIACEFFLSDLWSSVFACNDIMKDGK